MGLNPPSTSSPAQHRYMGGWLLHVEVPVRDLDHEGAKDRGDTSGFSGRVWVFILLWIAEILKAEIEF